MHIFLRNDGKKMIINTDIDESKGKNPIRIVLGHNGLAPLEPAQQLLGNGGKNWSS